MKIISYSCLIILVISIFLATCGKEKDEKKEVVVIPPNTLFIINSQPVPAAYKVDTTQAWVVLDSSAALIALLKSVEDNYKRVVAQQSQQQKK